MDQVESTHGWFLDIYTQQYDALYANVKRIVADHLPVQDILQDTFLSLWQYARNGHQFDCVDSWLFVVSRNKSISQLKKIQQSESVKFQLSADPVREIYLPDNFGNNAFSDADLRKLQLLRSAVESLSPRRRQAFILCKVEGKTVAEAATILRTTNSTIKEYLKQSMRLIRKSVSLASENYSHKLT